jgi:hypothetical protein
MTANEGGNAAEIGLGLGFPFTFLLGPEDLGDLVPAIGILGIM